MRPIVWTPVVVLSALVAGVTAFAISTPEPPAPLPASALGFAGLSQPDVADAASHAATYHRALQRAGVAQRGATAAARTWLERLPMQRAVKGGAAPASAVPAAIRVAAVGKVPRGHVTAFAKWADDLPAGVWTASVRPAVHVAGDVPSSDRFEVAGIVTLTLAQASTRVRVQHVPVTVRLDGVTGRGDAAPSRWLVRDVRVSGTDLVRAYRDPVVVHRAAVDVVAPASERAEAVAVADLAQAALPALHERYAGVGGAGVTTIWLIEHRGRARRVLGRVAPAATLTEPVEAPHAFTWVDPRGDVMVVLDRAKQVPVAARRAELRRELTLLATRRLVGVAPPVLVEGLAAWELRRADAAAQAETGAPYLAPLAAAFEAGDVDLRALLFAQANRTLAPGSTPQARRVAVLGGEATIAYIDDTYDFGALVLLLTQLRNGVEVERAVPSVLRISIETLEMRVAVWTKQRVAPVAATTPTDDAVPVGDPQVAEDEDGEI